VLIRRPFLWQILFSEANQNENIRNKIYLSQRVPFQRTNAGSSIGIDLL